MSLILQQRQHLNLSMTIDLRQAIELLQYSTYELEKYIREQELENPLIELEERNAPPVYRERLFRKPKNQDVYDLEISSGPSSDEVTRDTLYETVKLSSHDNCTKNLLKYLVYNLDDNGYLSCLKAQSNNSQSFTEPEIETGIQLLQKIGPPGIGARNFKECLLLQIRHTSPENSMAEYLVENCLHLLADRKWKDISSYLNIQMSEVKNLHEFIQTLNPRPCSFTSGEGIEYVSPDVIVTLTENQLFFSLNDGYLPAIHVNENYVTTPRPKDEVSKYINTQYQKYQWLINSIEQRRNTIIKIINVLLIKQEAFFWNGLSHLKPLTLREVAEETGVHESTVSRAIANKVIQTSFGSYELHLLFSSKLETSTGDCVSQTKVKNMMLDFITNENKQKPYSDQKITEYFNVEKGISISRRTISKYREELRIPSSTKRKEIK